MLLLLLLLLRSAVHNTALANMAESPEEVCKALGANGKLW